MELLYGIKRKTMKYSPKLPDSSVNIPQQTPLRDLFTMLFGFLGALVLFYILLGFAVSIVAPRIPPSIEKGMGTFFSDKFCDETDSDDAEKLMEILKGLESHLSDDDKRLEYRICVSKNKEINAVALPGGSIVVFRGLLDEVKNENELAFVIAHELGHFHNRDHLKGLGRSLFIVGLSAMLTGSESAGNFIVDAVTTIEMKFSREQEKAADLFAIDLLNKKYGNAKGGIEFMKKLSEKGHTLKFGYYFASHPHPEWRIGYMQKAVKKMNDSQ